MQFSKIDELLNLTLDTPSKKKKVEYGLKVAQGIFGSADRSSDGYYGKRYRQWRMNREFSYGTNTMKEFMDLMRIEGNQSYINIDWTPIKIAPKFVEILLGQFMNRIEKPIVKAVDDMSIDSKEMEKQEARFRMVNKDRIKAIEQEMGEVIDSNKFIPEDEDDLALYFDLEYRLPEEILFEQRIKKVLDDNDYKILKRQLLRDVIDVNFAFTKVGYDANGNITIKRCKPENMIYNVFEADNGRDISYIGEVYPMKISEIRRTYNIDEDTLFELAQKASRDLKRSENLYWRDSYRYTEVRPYDDYSVLIFDFEVKTVDVEYSVKTENKFGNMLVVSKQGKPVAPQGQEILGEVIESKKMNIYRGVLVCDTSIMLSWGVSPNVLRPYQNGVDAFFSYSVICPNANGGLIPSIIEKAMSPIRQMVLIRLKMQQLISTMRPDGYMVDIAGLRDIDIGLGNSVEPLKLMRIWDQTGRVFWDSTGDDGERKAPPITPLPSNQNVAMLNTLIQQYNFELDRLREEMGISEYKDGSSVPVKTGLGVMQNQIQASNNATEYIYSSVMQLMEDTCKKVAIMIWDSVILKSVKFKEFEGYDTRLMDMSFDVRVNLTNDDQEVQELYQLLSAAMQNGLITYEQAFKIKHIEDVKLAELYLSRCVKRAKKEAQEAAQRNMDMNVQSQIRSAQNKAQMDAQIEQVSANAKIMVNKSKSDGDKEVELIKMASGLYTTSLASGQPIPQELKLYIDTILKNAIMPQMEQGREMEQEGSEMEQEGQEMEQEGQEMEQEGSEMEQEGSEVEQES